MKKLTLLTVLQYELQVATISGFGVNYIIL